MNTRSLIDSGQIELYVAGAISKEEKRLIDELIAEYPEIKDEINAAEERWRIFAQAYSRNPRPKIRKTIIDLVVREGARFHILEHEDDVKARNASDIKWWLTALAIGLLIMVSALNVMFYLKWNEAEDKLMQTNKQLEINLNDSITQSVRH